MNIHSLKMKRTVILHSEKTLEPFARSQKQIPTPAVFTTRTVRFESLQRYRFVQVDRCPSALSIAQWPFNLRTVEKVKWTLTESSGCTKLLACRTFKEKKLQKHKKAPVSTEIPLYKSSFSVFFLFLCYILGTKKKSQAPKKTTPTPSQPPQEMFRLAFSKAPIWCPLSSDFFSHFFVTKKGPPTGDFPLKYWLFKWRDPYNGL